MKVNILQDRPTRVTIAGERYRFGIVSAHRDDGSVRFTVLHDGRNEPYEVREGDRVDAAGLTWDVAEIDATAGGDTFVQLISQDGTA